MNPGIFCINLGFIALNGIDLEITIQVRVVCVDCIVSRDVSEEVIVV